jgi:hypothetical protein
MMRGPKTIHASVAGAVLLAIHLPSRAVLNGVILIGGIVLQTALVFVLFRRGIARRFPAFTSLLTFYPLRAALLVALGGRIDADAYETWHHVLAIVEVVLQVWVAVEIALRLTRALGGWALKQIVLLLLLAGCACGLAWITLEVVAKKELADSLQVLWWFVMLSLFAGTLKAARQRNLFRIAAGFAAFSVVQLAALAGRSHAVVHHANGSYVLWSYVPACGYLAVVVFWICVLRREEGAAQARLRPACR